MASVGVYSIKDEVAEMFGPLFEAINPQVAVRSYLGMMRKVASWDRDAYRLYLVGSWDSEIGELRSHDAKLIDVNIPKFEDIDQKKFDFVEEK